jgi:Arc/MetJ-type ribon-helix-helix transcriptional regulator
VSQSDLIRQAIDDLLARTGTVDRAELLDEIAGIWSEREDIPAVGELRRGWRKRGKR